MISSLRLHTATKPVQTNQYHNSQYSDSKQICLIFHTQKPTVFQLTLSWGLVSQNKWKRSFQVISRRKKEYKQHVLNAQYLGNDKFIFQLIVKQRYFHKPTYRSLRKTLLTLRDKMNQISTELTNWVFHIYHVV